MHFAYIASLEQEEYIKKLYDHYWGERNKDINDVPMLYKDYGNEIIVNSRIKLRKQVYFKYSFYIVIIVTGMLVVVLENYIVSSRVLERV